MKTVKNIPAAFAPRRTRTPNIDYALLFNGECHILTQGDDFISDMESFIANVKDAARRKGFKLLVAVSTDPNTPNDVAVQALSNGKDGVKAKVRRSRGNK